MCQLLGGFRAHPKPNDTPAFDAHDGHARCCPVQVFCCKKAGCAYFGVRVSCGFLENSQCCGLDTPASKKQEDSPRCRSMAIGCAGPKIAELCTTAAVARGWAGSCLWVCYRESSLLERRHQVSPPHRVLPERPLLAWYQTVSDGQGFVAAMCM